MPKKRLPSPVSLLSGEKKEDKKDAAVRSRHKTTHVDHHDDGSMTVRHTPHSPRDGERPGDEVSYAVKDLDELHDGIEEHLGDSNDDEEG